MTDSSKYRPVRSETIRSKALLQKEITVTETSASHGRHWLSGTRLKTLLFPLLHWAFRHSPGALALIPVRTLVWIMGMLYGWRKNPLRRACESVCRIAGQSGNHSDPAQVYRRFLANSLAVVENYYHLYRTGIEDVSGHIQLGTENTMMIRELAQTHGGVVLAVPHNIASALSSLKLNQAFPLLVVARNSPTITRTRIALDTFERMEVPVLMVRGGNPFELSRTLFSVLRKGTVIAATLDNLDNSDNRVMVKMFGQNIGLSNWAAKIAVRTGVPIVPCYFRSEKRQVNVIIGKPIKTTDIELAVRQYASFFEQHILSEPASWAYLVDKRWRQILGKASTQAINSAHPDHS